LNCNWLAAALAAGMAMGVESVSADPDGSADPEGFAACVAQLGDQARERGLPAESVDPVLAGLEYQARVIELDRAQPEFSQTFAAYLRTRVTDDRVRRGRELLARHEGLLERLTREFGVPGRYLIAFWGLETNYGSFLGSMPTLDSLATLACDPRRAGFFSEQFLTGLELLQREELSPEQMRGSWAGAMGHTQFMPSAYLEHAVDGDGDGRIDLWGSIEDALASAANYLNHLGWNSGERWGREVRLPDDFPWHESGIDLRRPLEEWAALGVRRADGGPLPVADFDAALLLPMGHRGAAFLVYPNFDVIMRWNRSQAYALSVGILADRVVGGSGVSGRLSLLETLPSRTQLKQLQQTLAALGFDPGEPDGIFGPATREALRAFQRQAGKPADGYPDADTIAALESNSLD